MYYSPSISRFICLVLIVMICWNFDVTLAQKDSCQEREDPLPAKRLCRKSCITDSDCKSKKKSCQCDGICGLSCIKHNQECGPLANIPHGRVVIKPDNRFGAVAQYSCDEGYKLSGDEARVCQGDQEWSGSIPQCFVNNNVENSDCITPPKILNARHDGPPERTRFSLGSMLHYRCLEGYTLSADAIVRAWCVGGRAAGWVGPNMNCSRNDADCPTLDDVRNGWIEHDHSNTVNAVARYHCKRGFFLAGRHERRCLSNGKWEGVPPSCEEVTCRTPPKIENAIHDGDPEQELYPSGQQLLYTCFDGYSGDGLPRAMCSGDGKWVGLTLLCSAISCGFPGDLENGWRTGYVFTYPNKVNFYCLDGFELVGVGYRTCQANGKWSGTLPTCEPVTCPALFAPVYGHMYGSGTGYGTVIRFECDEGYKVIGSAERRCQSDRTWSGLTAKCEEINCGWPGPFYNGYLIGHQTTVGGTIFFSCNTRTSFEGEKFQTQCLETGEWSSKPPICWGQCQVPSIPNATLQGGREMGYVNHRTVIHYDCRGGLVPKGDPEMRCHNGTWSSTAECVPAPCPSAPPHVLNGMRVYMGREHGFKAKYKCFAGYRLHGMNGTYLTCEFGDWQGGRPRCEEFHCPNPGTIEHGQVFKKVESGTFDFKPYMTQIVHGYRLSFECDAGYRVDGPGGATCVNGQWQPELSKTKCVEAKHPPFKKLWKPKSNIFS
ncbi:hypothetical protein ACF0H5_021761 [Mactra antiquata]